MSDDMQYEIEARFIDQPRKVWMVRDAALPCYVKSAAEYLCETWSEGNPGIAYRVVEFERKELSRGEWVTSEKAEEAK